MPHKACLLFLISPLSYPPSHECPISPAHLIHAYLSYIGDALTYKRERAENPHPRSRFRPELGFCRHELLMR